MDYKDFLGRECLGLFSQLLVQCPVSKTLVFDAVEKCIPYQRPDWKFHYYHTDDSNAYETAQRAVDYIEKNFSIINIHISESKVVILDPPEIKIFDSVHCPVLFKIQNESPQDLSISMSKSSLNLWQQPRDPWNISKIPSPPACNAPAGKISWMVATILTELNELSRWSFAINFSNEEILFDVPVKMEHSHEITIATFDSIESIDSDKSQIPAMITVSTSLSTCEVPSGERNYMHVTPRGMHPFSYCSDFVSSSGEIKLKVPSGLTTITCRRGPEYSIIYKNISVEKNETIDLYLSKISNWDMFSRGWISGDTHVHWAKTWVYLGDDTPELSTIQKACDCHVAAVLTLSQFDGYQEVFTPVHHPVGVIEEHSDDRYIMAMDEEFRNSGPYGHVNLLGLKKLITPVSTGFTKTDTAPDYPDNSYAFIKAHEQGAIAMCSHGIHSFDKVLIALGHMDCVDQVYEKQYYQILNCGFKIPLTVGTDANARPVGKMRTYVKTELPFNYESWLDGIRKGRTFVTNGPLLKFTVNGSIPGDNLEISGNDKLDICASAFCQTPLDTLQIVFNGKVVFEKKNISGELEINLQKTLSFSESGWIAVKAFCGEVCDWMDNAPGAHTSPVYIVVDNKQMVPDKTSAQEIVSELEQYIADLPARAKFDNENQRNEVVNRILAGIEVYRKLL